MYKRDCKVITERVIKAFAAVASSLMRRGEKLTVFLYLDNYKQHTVYFCNTLQGSLVLIEYSTV